MNSKAARAKLQIITSVALAFAASAGDTAADIQLRAKDAPEQARVGVCEREAEKLLGQKPVRIGGSIPAPKKIRGLSPSYPKLPPGTIGSGMWIGAVLVNNSGKVAKLWPIREVTLKPAFPAFNKAIVDAILGWEYEPVLLGAKPSPFCMTVSVNIDWQ